MALGMEARRQAESAFGSLRNWNSSTGNLRGVIGAPHSIGWLNGRADAATLRESARRAMYTVWSYDTPIGWVIDKPEGFEYVIPTEVHSNTTSAHQGILRVAWSGCYHDGTHAGRAAWLRQHGNLDGLKRAIYLYREYRDDDIIATRRRPRRAVAPAMRDLYQEAFHWVVIETVPVAWAMESPEDPAIAEHIVLRVDNELSAVGRELLELVRAVYPHHHDGTERSREGWLAEVGLSGKPKTIGRKSKDPFGIPFERPGGNARVAR